MPGIKAKIRNHIPSNLVGKPKEKMRYNKTTGAELTNLQIIKAKLSQNSLVDLKLGFEEVDFYTRRDVQSLIKVIKEQFWRRVIVDKASPLQSIKIGWRLPNFAVGPVLQQVIPLLLQEPVRVTCVQLILNAWVPEDCLRRIVSWPSLTTLDLRSVRVRCPLLTVSAKDHESNDYRNSSSSSSISNKNIAVHHRHRHRHHGNGNTHRNSVAATAADGYVDASTFAWLSDDTTSSSSSSIIHLGAGAAHSQQHLTASMSARTTTTTPSASSSESTPVDNPGLWTEERNVVCMVPYMSSNIETLKLVDCGIHEGHIPDLCHHLRRRRCLHYLSLRQNRSLDGGFSYLFELPYVQVLDLSLCDLDAHNGNEIKRALSRAWTVCGTAPSAATNAAVVVANAGGTQNESTGVVALLQPHPQQQSSRGQKQQQRQIHLRKLCLNGNYRLFDAIPGLVEASSDRLVELDCSFCDVQGKLQTNVFRALAESPGCTLQCFRMQGARIVNIKNLLNCINNNKSLRRLILDHPREPFPISHPQMEQISDALEFNFHLQDLKVDTFARVPKRIQKKIDFWLTLNQCGRASILNETTNSQAWSVSLSEAAKKDDPNILFWLLKHGSASFSVPQEANS